jgi:ribonuclease PH
MDVKLGEFLGDMASMRTDGREANELRTFRIEAGVQQYAEGSAMVEMGRTKVLCTATVEERVPPFMRGQGTGWVTAEYAMLPRSSPVRISRESSTGRVKGRTHEIQRLIGRALRGVTDLSCLGERQVLIDCDVLVADGGTRTASITGAWVAFAQAIQMLHKKRVISKDPLLDQIAAISVGVVDGVPLLDLCYEEDSSAEVDMNIVMTRSGKFVEVQGTAETAPFTDEQLQQMLAHGRKGIDELLTAQRDALTSAG